MSRQEHKNKLKGIIVTIAVHLSILLLLFVFAFRTPYPPPPEEGILIDFGSSDNGLGAVQPVQEDVQPELTPVEEISSASASAPEELLAQDYEEAPTLPVQKEEEETKPIEEPMSEKIEKVEEVKEKPKPVVDETLLFKKSNTSNTAQSEGETTYSGDQGKEDGAENGHKGDEGFGLGNEGIGYDLSGRAMLLKPRVEDQSQETGVVVVRIKVDREGRVLHAKYQLRGSNTNSPHLINLAVEASKKATFNKDVNALEEQWGTITYSFKVK